MLKIKKNKRGKESLEFPNLYDDRDIILSRLNEAIEYLHDKATKGRIKNSDTDKVKIQYFKALAYTCSIYNQIKRDVDIDELNLKIEEMTREIRELKEFKEYEESY